MLRGVGHNRSNFPELSFRFVSSCFSATGGPSVCSAAPLLSAGWFEHAEFAQVGDDVCACFGAWPVG